MIGPDRQKNQKREMKLWSIKNKKDGRIVKRNGLYGLSIDGKVFKYEELDSLE
jgi:hypothetical protein